MSRPEYQKAPFNPFIALGVGICAVSTGAIFARLADAPAIVIAAYRVGLAAIKLSLLAYIQVCYGAAAVILWLMVLGAGFPITGFTGGTWAAFWGMALIPQLIGHTSYNWSLRWFSTSLVAISLLGEPIGATILGYLIFGEGLTVTKVIGGALILTAIYIASAGQEKRTGSKGEKRDGRERAEADSTG